MIAFAGGARTGVLMIVMSMAVKAASKAAGGVFDDEERVEPVQGDRVEVEQVAGQERLRSQ